ncbi:MAG: NAD(P)/FAD-dependent oxidoreductase [Candidatus Aenigmarchaeota archaeon]|nr:NAD(P)/FAD-dependent oxidoreductase [Candidatus Aenigmarchaeota archaeon]
MLKNFYDVVIVGGGPAGCKTAELASSLGLSVLLIEEHEEIGKPVQCSGINSHRIISLSGLKEREIVVNKVYKARIFGDNETFLELKSPKPVYVIDRQKLDEGIAKLAIKRGCEIQTGVKFENFKRRGNFLLVHTSSSTIKTKILVGADGPNSTVAKLAKIEMPKEYVIGYQQTIRGDFSDNIVELWFGKTITPDFFGWVIPENDEWARVGIASKRNVGYYFENFVRKRFGKNGEKKDIVAGIIRYGLIKTSVSDNILLVGDAASHIKAYSGGGIIYGLIASHIAAKACFNAVKSKRYDRKFLEKEYDFKWRMVLERPIKRGLLLHKLLHSMPNNAFSALLKLGKPLRFFLNKMDMDLLFTR